MKMKEMLGLVMALGIVISTPLMAADYVIDNKGHAFVSFKASHLGYSYVIGTFNDFEGSFSHDADNPAASKTSVIIDAKSVDTNHAKRDKHLRSNEFLDVAKYPTIMFESTSYKGGSNGDKLTGDLTIHGVTKSVTLDVVHIGEGPDPWNGYRSGFEGSVTVKASDFGMAEWLGNIEISIIAEGIRQ